MSVEKGEGGPWQMYFHENPGRVPILRPEEPGRIRLFPVAARQG